jgi:hypothetical protein
LNSSQPQSFSDERSQLLVVLQLHQPVAYDNSGSNGCIYRSEEKQLQTNEVSHVTALGKYCPSIEEYSISYWDDDMEAVQCIKWSEACLSFHLVTGQEARIMTWRILLP